MGTISQVKSKKGGPSTWCAQIRRKQGGKVVLSISQTFAREQAARAWMKKKEDELAKPGGLERAIAKASAPVRPTLDDAIDRDLRESERELKKTKAQVLRAIREDEIASIACEDIRSDHLVAFAKRLLDRDREPSTVGNYMSHLSSIFSIARPAWGYPLDQEAMKDAMKVCKRLGYTGKSKRRERRPTLEELDKLMTHFVERSQRRRRSAPMHKIIAMAIFSTRRQGEICGLCWDDLDEATAEQAAGILVRKMKNPGDDGPVDRWCELMPEALAIIHSMPRVDERIFPYKAATISTTFTDACEFLGIEDLHFHDFRHEAISWLIENGRTKEQAAQVSGHRSWSSLERYSNIRKIGNKYDGWKWFSVATEPLMPASAAVPSARRRGGRRYSRPGRGDGRC